MLKSLWAAEGPSPIRAMLLKTLWAADDCHSEIPPEPCAVFKFEFESARRQLLYTLFSGWALRVSLQATLQGH